jgi:hypothetical protein
MIKKLKKHRVLPTELKHMVEDSKHPHISGDAVASDSSEGENRHRHGHHINSSGSFVDMLKRGVSSFRSRSRSIPRIAPSRSCNDDDVEEALHALQDDDFVPIDTEGDAFLDLCRKDTPQDGGSDKSPDKYADTPSSLKNRGYSKQYSEVSEAGADDEAAVVTPLVPPEDTQITPVHPGTQQQQQEELEGLPLSASVAEEKRHMSSSHRVILPSLAADAKEEESCGKGLGGAGEGAVMSLLESDDEVVAISGTSFGGSVRVVAVSGEREGN